MKRKALKLLLLLRDRRRRDRTPSRENCVRNREHSISHIRSWSDAMFQRQFGLDRPQFFHVLHIVEPMLSVNRTRAIAAYRSEVCSELRLGITLRVLRGALYLDIDWYSVSVNHVWPLVIECMDAVITALDNICFPYDDNEKMEALRAQFNYVQVKKYGATLTNGIVAAGDGLLIRTYKPYKNLSLAPTDYYNRKSTYGVVCQAFCDAWCRFVFMDSSFAGATNDIVAYHQTMMYICSAFMDEKFCLALDEAYSSIKDGKHLTPFSNGQLQTAWEAGDYKLHSKMRCFNQVFCSQWITIERAFGQLVRRWGIFW